ncbi:uncharacterized protein LOC117654314 [Thrips palmi]|uniref:Uncharacterized protein LOC117654314 n=1 Tax=Thrips palmi TaxID=161013 RepID=A0A6P9AH57_THRPL|nr:uncharacterized protein LOC117654314 [Thrips palmi]
MKLLAGGLVTRHAGGTHTHRVVARFPARLHRCLGGRQVSFFSASRQKDGPSLLRHRGLHRQTTFRRSQQRDHHYGRVGCLLLQRKRLVPQRNEECVQAGRHHNKMHRRESNESL